MLYIWWTILWFLTFCFRQSTKRWQNRQGVLATAPDENYNEDDKRRLKKAIQDNKDTIEDLRQYGPLDTKTIDSMRLSLFTATAIDRL